MNVIGIYHHPQECGDPFVAVISQETGMEVDRIRIPEGYSWEGMTRVEKLKKLRSFTEEVCSSNIPDPRKYQVKQRFMPCGQRLPNGNTVTYRVTKVDVNGEDSEVFHTYNCTVHIDAYEVQEEYRYIQSKDRFRAILEDLGFDMKPWPTPRRMKTDYMEFLRTVVTTLRPQYHLVNLIQIG